MTLETKLTGNFAALVIDMQSDFLARIKDEEKKITMIASQKEVLTYCATQDIPLVILEFRGHRDTISELKTYINFVPRYKHITKHNNDGFRNTNLVEQLREWETTNLVLMGINASACVRETAQGALDKGFNIFTAEQLICGYVWPDKRIIPWYKQNGTYFEDYKELLKIMK